VVYGTSTALPTRPLLAASIASYARPSGNVVIRRSSGKRASNCGTVRTYSSGWHRRDITLTAVAASYDFEGRTALITGGAGDIGGAVARTLKSAGAQVATLDLRAADLDGVLALTGDVSRSEDVEESIGRVEAELGRLDIVVCAAGVAGESLRTVEVPDEEWRRVFAINCDGVFFTNRAAARVMVPRAYGRIVNVASIAGKEGNPMAAAYSASKAAVIGMTKSIGKDLAETGVLVNCVAPAVIHTRMLGELSEEHIEYMVERIPMKRMGQPEEAAALITFLASEQCSFSTAAVFDLSGGRATY